MCLNKTGVILIRTLHEKILYALAIFLAFFWFYFLEALLDFPQQVLYALSLLIQEDKRKVK